MHKIGPLNVKRKFVLTNIGIKWMKSLQYEKKTSLISADI